MKKVFLILIVLIIGLFSFEKIKAKTCEENGGVCTGSGECVGFGGSCNSALSPLCATGCCCMGIRGETKEKWKCDYKISFFLTGGCEARLAPECPKMVVSLPGAATPTEVEVCELGHLKELICNLIKFVVNCLAQVAFMFGLAFGGFKIMFAAGDPKKLEEGKAVLIRSVVGFLIVVLAGELINLILNL